MAFSEYGASLWADPTVWVPESARLLGSGGRLVFLTNSFLIYLCFPNDGVALESLQRPQFGPMRAQSPDSPGTEYHLAQGEWIRLLRRSGFEVEDLAEIQAPLNAELPLFYEITTVEWAHRWPAEEIWVARKRI